MIINPLTAIDFYKADHRNQYPKGTTEVYSNLTPRSRRLANVLDDFDDQVVVFGLQYFIKHFLQESKPINDAWTTPWVKAPLPLNISKRYTI